MHSSNLLACVELDELWETLDKHRCTMYVYSVRSADNASDTASRNFDLCLMDATQRAAGAPEEVATLSLAAGMMKNGMQAQVQGWDIGDYLVCPDQVGMDGIRHGDLGKIP